MPYSNAIPQPTDTPSTSQPQLLANFQAIQTAFEINHVAFNTGDEGKHKWVSLPQQTAAPATAASEIALYGINSAETSVTELAFRRPSSGTEVLCTERDGTTTGWSMLPSGLLIKWSFDTANGVTVIDSNSFGKAFTALYHVQINNLATTVATNTYPMGGAISGTNFTVTGVQRTVANTAVATLFNWLAIGLP
jgi:hypothetical protein